MLKVENLSKQFGDHYAVRNVNFTLSKNECVALIGPNGSGKTTILRLLIGLVKQTEGTVTFINKNMDIRSTIGYLPQYPSFYNWMTGKEFLHYCGKLYSLSKEVLIERANHLLSKVNLQDAKNKSIGTYSGGMKQRLGLAQALLHDPKVLLLDEPVSALDPIGRREVLNLMTTLKKEKTILFSTHILNDAEEVSDRFIFLKKGNIVEAGTMDELDEKYTTAKIIIEFAIENNHIMDILNALPFVTKIDHLDGSYHIYTTNIEETHKDILRVALDSDLFIKTFSIGSISVEEIFIKAVHK